MNYQCIHQGIASSLPSFEPVLYMEDRPARFNISLFIETLLTVIVAVVAIKAIGDSSTFGTGWLITPGILIFAAFIPTAVKKRKFPGFGFNIRQMKDSLVMLGWTCAVLFPLTFCGLWVLKSFGLKPPLAPGLSQGRDWVYWLFYQFMYVALSEEVFFRGYLQSNILRLTTPAMGRLPRLHQWASIVISAACFTAAHIIIQGQIISVLIFLPGLVLGWLFIRTRSLLAPILFHGLANACYLVMAIILT
jgi:membrane protease YdiL (CAAX protease family)